MAALNTQMISTKTRMETVGGIGSGRSLHLGSGQGWALARNWFGWSHAYGTAQAYRGWSHQGHNVEERRRWYWQIGHHSEPWRP